MERTLRILVIGSQDGVRGFGRKDVVVLVKEEEVEGVWQMERTNTWYVTFASTRPLNDFDGQEVGVPDHRVILELCACDRIKVEMKVHWLPFWVSNDTVGECFDRFEDIKNIKHIKDSDDIATGDERGCDLTREGDQRYLPYFTSMDCNRTLVTAPGRPPSVLDMRAYMKHECPNFVFTQSTGRNYATAVHTPAVSKAGQGAVGRPQVQGRREAVDKSPSVSNTEEVVSMPPSETEQGPAGKPPAEEPQ